MLHFHTSQSLNTSSHYFPRPLEQDGIMKRLALYEKLEEQMSHTQNYSILIVHLKQACSTPALKPECWQNQVQNILEGKALNKLQIGVLNRNEMAIGVEADAQLDTEFFSHQLQNRLQRGLDKTAQSVEVLIGSASQNPRHTDRQSVLKQADLNLQTKLLARHRGRLQQA